ncbi:Bax inhibitor-1/YccA family protein [Flavobacterium sp.]|uniref:Bax inhibitor-1/YccA family protein n=1 Tax=Flavobacterium sp. TaxID=239 RepID=UPI003753153E
MESKNPFFRTKSFTNTSSVGTSSYETRAIDYTDTMTVSGTINKSFILLLLLVASASLIWNMSTNPNNLMVFAIGGAIVGFILVLVSTFKPHLSTYLAPAYAVFEGLFIGGISAIFEMQYPGIVINAIAATFVTFLVCLGLYKYKIVKVTEKFKSIVIAATVAIAVYYLGSWIFSMIFSSFQPVHYGNSNVSIGISVFVIIIASLNLFLDFDQIDKGAEQKMPKYMEWYGAMGLMITLVWLYIEFLRLLSKLGRD